MNKHKLTIKDSSLSFLVGFLLCQLGVVVATCIASIFYTLSNKDTTNFFAFLNTGLGYMITALSLYLIMLLVFLFFNKKKENLITGKIKISKLLIYIALAISSFFALYPIITCFDSLLSLLGAKINTLPYSLTTKNYFLSIISMVIAPAICEELLFRGLIFKGLKQYGKIFSITLSSIMFSIYHMAFSQTLYPLLFGLLLGVIMFYENNIYYCIAMHMANNFLSLTLAYFKINLVYNHWSYIIMAIILAIAFITVVIYFTIRKHKEFEKQQMNKTEKIYLFSTLTIMIIFWLISSIS